MEIKLMTNKGEENEVVLKAFLAKCHFQYVHGGVEMKDGPEEFRKITQLNFGPDINIPVWLTEYDEWLDNRDYVKLKKVFGKAKTSFKADIGINGVNYSVKFGNSAKAAMINHTSRDGFINVCKRLNIDIAPLDEMIREYWSLRKSGKITEDITNSSQLSPFKKHKEYLKPILEYFFFKGTGKRGDSDFPADKLLIFKNAFDPSTYKIISLDEAVDSVWDNLTFSMRSKKGMPTKKVAGQLVDLYSSAKYPMLAPWVEYRSDEAKFPKGALHVRS